MYITEPYSTPIISEVELQRRIIAWIEKIGGIVNDTEGVPVQILSIGEWNNTSGPDFKGCAFLRNGQLFVGDAEVHFKAADWFTHGHHADSAYAHVVLHLFCYGKSDSLPQLPCSIRLPLYLLQEQHASVPTSAYIPQTDVLLDVQDYSFRRLERKSTIFEYYCNTTSFHDAISLMLKDLFSRRGSRRPQFYLSAVQQYSIQCVVQKIINDEIFSVEKVLSTSWAGEGHSLRNELLVNIVLPVLYSCEGKKREQSLMIWWSTKALHSYKHLQKRFPNIEQEFIWQQQGLLEWEFVQQQSRTSEPQNVKEQICDYNVRQFQFVNNISTLSVA